VQLRAASRTADKLDVSGTGAGRHASSSLALSIVRPNIRSPRAIRLHQKRQRGARGDMSILQTERLILRPFREPDLDRLAELFANPDFMRFSLGVYTREQTATFLDKIIGWQRAGLPSLFAVELKPKRPLLGYCGFFHHPPEVTADVEIGYRLHPDYWNRGLMTEAARAVRDHAFRDLKLPRVISLVHPENIASRRVAEKNGMTITNEIIFRGFPTLMFAIEREQWLAQHAAA
jgi:ribosomal-protein-alanine N-acetyltransferase